jgi:glycosyltransferase involved in cell wall biosynthesis
MLASGGVTRSCHMPVSRILHVIGRMDRAGAETLVVTLLHSLDRSRYQFDFLVRSTEPGHYDSELIGLGCRIFRCSHRPNPLAYCKTAYAIMRHQGPYHAVHSHLHYFDGLTLTIARAAGIPVRISHSHSTSDGCGGSRIRTAYRQMMRAVIRLSATHRVGVSDNAYSALFGEDEPAEGKIIARNGLRLSQFDPSNALDLRRERNLPPHACLIGHVGRMIPSKNHAFLLQVFAELRKLEPLAELILVGEGPMKAMIRALARDLNVSEHVHFLGIRDDVCALLQSLDGFIFPSHYEGLGIAVVEAQAAGLPCVASKAVPEEADVGCGLLHFLSVEEGPEVWATLLAKQLRAPRPNWELRAACLGSSGYDMADIAKTWMDIYNGAGTTHREPAILPRPNEQAVATTAADWRPR